MGRSSGVLHNLLTVGKYLVSVVSPPSHLDRPLSQQKVKLVLGDTHPRRVRPLAPRIQIQIQIR